MKKLLILIAILGAFSIYSCSENDLQTSNNSELSKENNIPNLDKVFNDLNKLNSKYGTSRGKKPNLLYPRNTVDFADLLGQKCGNYLGRWAGTAIGSSAGGPLGACVGHVLGWRIGGHIGYGCASIIAKMYLDCAGLAMKIEDADFLYNNKINVSFVITKWAEVEYEKYSVERP